MVRRICQKMAPSGNGINNNSLNVNIVICTMSKNEVTL